MNGFLLFSWLDPMVSLVLRVSLEGALIILVVVALQRLMRRRLGPSWAFALWFVVLLRLSLPALPPSSLSWQRWLKVWPGASQMNLAASWAPAAASAPASLDSPASQGAPPIATPHSRVGTLSPREARPLPPLGYGSHAKASTEGPFTGRWRSWVGLAWFVVAGTLVLRFAVGMVLLGRRLRNGRVLHDAQMARLTAECRREVGMRAEVPVWVSSEVSSPGVFGVWRPVVLVPEELVGRLDEEEWRHILRHEFAHIRRRDVLWNAWSCLLACVHWFNPLVWWATARMRRDRELACDDLALRGTSSAVRRSYGQTLLKIASLPVESRLNGALVGIAENAQSLRERLGSLVQNPRAVRFQALAGLLVVGLVGAGALTRTPGTPPTPAANRPPFEALDLRRHTDHPVSAVANESLQDPNDRPGMWQLIPRGRQTFFGVPFEVSGLIRLAGTDARREEWYFRPQVEGIPVGRVAGRIYLLHSTYYYASNGTEIARLRMNYTDRTSAELPIRYGQHTLNFWRQRYEAPADLSDPDARVVWEAELPVLARYGNSLRLCVTSFLNPRPDREIASLDLISAGASASEVVVGVAVGGTDLPGEWRETPIARGPEQDWKRRLRFKVVDRQTGRPVAGMRLRLEVAEEGAHCRIATHDTDATGTAELRFPDGPLTYLSIWANHDAYVPRFIQWTRRQHGDFPEEYLYRAEPGISVGGRIVDEQGKPVAEALVRLEGPQPNFAGDAKEFLMFTKILTVSDRDGAWSTSVMPRDLPAEKVRIRVLHPEFPDGATRILAESEKDGTVIPIVMHGGRAVIGRVVDGDARPIRGARVRIRPIDGLGSEVATFSDATGTFLLRPSASSSSLVLLAESEGLAPTFASVPDENSGELLPEITMGRGENLEVNVQDPEGKPVVGAAIGGLYVRGRFALEPGLRTDARGLVVWTNAPQEELMVEATLEGWQRAMFARQKGQKEITLQMPRLQEVRGWVSDATSGLALPYFRVWRGQQNPAAGETEWESEPAALGRNGAFRVVQGPAAFPVVYRFDAPGYGTSGEFTTEALGARREAIPLKPW